MAVLISGCLLGRNCKYNGGNNYAPKLLEALQGKTLIPICPELEAGLGVPRTPIEIVDGVLRDQQGNSVDAQVREAIDRALKRLEGEDIEFAVLKSRSPTCGVRQVYDGTFTGRLVDGAGVLAKTLMDAGYRVIDSEELV